MSKNVLHVDVTHANLKFIILRFHIGITIWNVDKKNVKCHLTANSLKICFKINILDMSISTALLTVKCIGVYHGNAFIWRAAVCSNITRFMTC